MLHTSSARAATLLVGGLALVACTSGDGGGQPQTEQGVVQAVEQAQRGALRGNAGAVLNALSEECRSQIDEAEVRFAVQLAPGFLESLLDGVDVDDLDVETTVVDYEGETASVEVSFVGPGGDAIESLGVGSDQIDMVYENGKWVDAGCDFLDESEIETEEVEATLAELGYAGTRDDPVPAGVAVPVGDGYVLAVDSLTPDAFDALSAEIEFLPEPEVGDQYVLLGATVGYEGAEEPQSVAGVDVQAVGPNSIGIDSYGCGGFSSRLGGSTELFVGGVVDGELCFAVPNDQVDDLLITASAGFGLDREVFFDPTASGAATVAVESTSGPAPDGRLSSDRMNPTPVGETVDLGDGWSITVLGFDSDATSSLLAANEFNDPPPDGFVYSFVDYELRYDGTEDSQNAITVDVGLVGDSNVSADDFCLISDVPNEIERYTDLFVGGAISGNQCFVADRTDLDSLVLYAGVGFGDDIEVLALR
jgi:hypothetical protein